MLLNLIKIRETSWITISNGQLVWSFISRALDDHSNHNLLSNHIRSIIDIPNALKTFNCLLTGLNCTVYHCSLIWIKKKKLCKPSTYIIEMIL